LQVTPAAEHNFANVSSAWRGMSLICIRLTREREVQVTPPSCASYSLGIPSTEMQSGDSCRLKQQAHVDGVPVDSGFRAMLRFDSI
jgi:hypothetical protein